MSTVGRKLLSSIVHQSDLQSYMKLSLEEYLFKETELPLYQFIENHVNKYGKVPSQLTIEGIPGLEDAIVEAPEPPTYYGDEVEKRYLHNSLKATVQEVSGILQDSMPEAAMDVLMRYTATIYQKRRRRSLFDFRQAKDLILDAYLKQKTMSNEVSMPYGWQTLDDMSGGMREGDFVTFVGRPMAGKAQPMDSRVLTKDGWVAMGDIKVGQPVASVDGHPSVVDGVFPQGLKPVYRFTFQDGRTCKATDEHLWEVWRRDWEAPRIMTTLQIKEALQSKRNLKRLSIRMFSGDYGKEMPCKFSAYTLAALVGDGCFRAPAPMFSSADSEIIQRLGQDLKASGLFMVHTRNYDYRITGKDYKVNQLREWLKDLGLWGLKSEDKFIPEWVFRRDHAFREEFLQGLMDTDGTAGKNGSTSFSSSSQKLAHDTQRLVWSLGGRANVAVKLTAHLPSYRVSIVMPDRSRLFWLGRKAARVQDDRTCKVNTRLRIESVDYIGEESCQCISVTHPDHLYVTDNYVVTHNTFKLLYTAHNAWTTGRVPLFVSMEMMVLIITQRLASMHTKKKLTDLIKAELSTKAFNAMMQGLAAVGQSETPMWVTDGNLTSTVDDVVMLCHQLNPSAVFVDGAYLMDHPDKRMSKWDKQAENARALKQRVATDLGIPVVASYQLGKGAAKEKKKGKGQPDGMEDVHGSDEMAQLSTVMLGLFDDENDIEAKKKRRVKILKGRNGETGGFDINWDFSANMNFTEYLPEDPSTMQMEHMG